MKNIKMQNIELQVGFMILQTFMKRNRPVAKGGGKGGRAPPLKPSAPSPMLTDCKKFWLAKCQCICKDDRSPCEEQRQERRRNSLILFS
jgi:hypothetical protein